MLCLLTVSLLILQVTHSANLPSNFPVCKLDRTKLAECFAKAVEQTLPILKEPVPELGIPSIDPIEVERLHFDGGNGSIILNQDLRNVKIYNMTLTKVPKAEINIDGNGFKNVLHTFVPEMKLKADYEINGRILLLSIHGEGLLELNVYNLTTVISMTGVHVEKKGKTYLKINETKCSLSPGFVKMHFDNLFNGDQRLGDSMNQVLNDNWKDVFSEFQGAYEDVLAQYMTKVSGQVFNKVPLNDLFPPP